MKPSAILILFAFLSLVATASADVPWKSAYRRFYSSNFRPPNLNFEKIRQLIIQSNNQDTIQINEDIRNVFFDLADYYDGPQKPSSSTKTEMEDEDECESGWKVYIIVDLNLLEQAGLLSRLMNGETNFTVAELEIIAAAIKYVGSGTPRRAMHHFYGAKMLYDNKLDFFSVSPQAFGIATDYAYAMGLVQVEGAADKGKPRPDYGLIYLAETETVKWGRTLERSFVKALSNGLVNQGGVRGGETNFLEEIEYFLANDMFKELVLNFKDVLIAMDIRDFYSLKQLASDSRFGRTPENPYIYDPQPATIHLFTKENPLKLPNGNNYISYFVKLFPIKSIDYELTPEQAKKVAKLFKYYVNKVFATVGELELRKNALFVKIDMINTDTLLKLITQLFRLLDETTTIAKEITNDKTHKMLIIRAFDNISHQFDYAIVYYFYLNHDQLFKEHYWQKNEELPKTSPTTTTVLPFEGDDRELDSPPNVGDCYLPAEDEGQ